MQTKGQRLVWAARADLALARSDPGTVLDITERLIASASNLSDESVIPRLWKLRGETLAALGRTEEAEAVLRAAEVAARVQGLRPLCWQISVAQGLLYRTQGRKEEAAAMLVAALTGALGCALFGIGGLIGLCAGVAAASAPALAFPSPSGRGSG